jgi:hypothetical protein
MSKRKPTQPRILRQQFKTGAAETAAYAGKLFDVDYDGPKDVDGHYIGSQLQRGIRSPDGSFDPRPAATESAVYDEVARLNAGLPVSKKGIRRTPKKAEPAAQWVEIFLNVPWKRAFLQECVRTDRALSLEDIRELRTTNWDGQGATEVPEWLTTLGAPAMPPRPALMDERPTIENRDARQLYMDECKAVERAQAKLDEAISKQLARVMGIPRKESGRRNAWRDTKKPKP